LDQLSINTIRTLFMDAVQQANSGHPGTPMALAPLVYTIWNRVMRFDPVDPIWPNRDRFVLSNGHASMLLWSVLHLTGTRAVNAVQAHERLLAEGVRSRVVSMPSWDIFEHQPRDYRDSVLPPRVKARVAVEQGSMLGWERYVSESGRVIGMKYVRGLGSAQGTPEKVRFRARPCGSSCQAVARESVGGVPNARRVRGR
jgi:transketolase